MIITNVNEDRENRRVSTFNWMDSYKTISIINRGLTKNPRYNFNERIEFIFSEAFVLDNLRLCSLEQQAMLERYVVQAWDDDVPPGWEGMTETELATLQATLEDDLEQLDKFLGGL